MKRTLYLVLVAIVVNLVGLYAGEANKSTSNFSSAPSFDLTTVAGKKIKVSAKSDGLDYSTLKDKNVITMFYIFPGEPCRNELKIFSGLVKNHKDLEVVTFELRGLAPDKFPAFEKELGISGLNMIDKSQSGAFVDYIAKLTKWQGSVPLLMFTDKKGTAKHMQLGAMSKKEIEDMLGKL